MADLRSPSSKPVTETPSVAVITICVAPQTTELILGEVDGMPWAPVHEDLDTYPGVTGRPHWPSRIKNAKACIAVIDLDEDATAGLRSIEFLHQTLTGKVSIIALSSETAPAMILKCMRSGCSEFLSKPLEAAQFSEALLRLERRSSSTAENVPVQGRILSFFGAKGGVGTTTLAVHLAIHLMRNHGKKTLLIDNHAELGHVCLYLGLEGTHYSFKELLRSVHRLDTDLLQGFVVSHASGLHVIASAELHGTASETDPEALRRTLAFLREEYDYILLDSSTSLEEANMAVVEQSDQVFLVGTPDVGAIRDLSRLVDGLLRFQQPKEKLHVVINRSGSKGAMSTVQIEKAVRLPIFLSISNNYAELARAANMGLPVSPDEKSEFSSQLRSWSREIAGETKESSPAKSKKGLAFWK